MKGFDFLASLVAKGIKEKGFKSPMELVQYLSSLKPIEIEGIQNVEFELVILTSDKVLVCDYSKDENNDEVSIEQFDAEQGDSLPPDIDDATRDLWELAIGAIDEEE